MKTAWINYGELLVMKDKKIKYSRLKEIEEKLSPRNKKIIDDFMTYCSGCSKSKVALDGKRKIMLQILDIGEKPLGQLNLKWARELLSVLNNSKLSNARTNNIKGTLKRFLKYFYKDWNIKFNGFDDPAWKEKDERNHKKLNSSTMLQEDEIEKVIKIADPKYKAIISLMFESASRPEELLNLTWKNLDIVNKKVTLYSNKTGKSRTIPIKDSVHYIMKYRDNLEIKDKKILHSDLVFPSPKDESKPMSSTALSCYLSKLGKKVKLNKKFFPYLLRHTRLNSIRRGLSAESYEHFSGHSLATGMHFYSHIEVDDLNTEILEKVYKDEELSAQENEEIGGLKKEMETIRKEMKRLLLLEQHIYQKPSKKELSYMEEQAFKAQEDLREEEKMIKVKIK